MRRNWPAWISVHGAVFQLPAEWNDSNDHPFVAPDNAEHYLAWSAEGFTVEQAWAWLSKRREAICSSLEHPELVTPLGVVPHSVWPLFGFSAPLGGAALSPALSLFTLVHQAGAIVLRSRTTLEETAWLPGLWESIAVLPPGGGLALGRQSVLGVSFVWPRPLVPPSSFQFESADGLSRLRLAWRANPVANVVPNWPRLFAFEPGAQVQLLAREVQPVQAGALAPAGLTSTHKILLEQIRWTAAATTPSSEQSLTYLQARSLNLRRVIQLEFRSMLPYNDAMTLWAELLGSLNLEA